MPGDGTGSLGNASHFTGPLELPSHDLSANPSHIHSKPKHLPGCSNPFPSGSILSFQMDASLHPVTASHYCTPSLQLYHCIPVLHPITAPSLQPYYCPPLLHPPLRPITAPPLHPITAPSLQTCHYKHIMVPHHCNKSLQHDYFNHITAPITAPRLC